MFLFTAFTILAILHSAVASHCRNGFSASNNNGGVCYQVVDEHILMTWKSARGYCRDRHGVDLVRFDSLVDEVGVFPENSTWNYWIGLNDKQAEGQYKWLDDTNTTNYLNWGANQKTNIDNLDCVALGKLGWSEIFCETALPFICGYIPVQDEESAGISQETQTPEKEETESAGIAQETKSPEKEETESAGIDQEETPEKEETESAGFGQETEIPEKEETESAAIGQETQTPEKEEAETAENAQETVTTTLTPKKEEAVEACDDGWKMLGDVGCYKFFKDRKRTWWEAREECQKHDADLMVVPNADAHRLLKELFPKVLDRRAKEANKFKYWFGLNQQTDFSPEMWLNYVEKDPNFSRYCRQRIEYEERPLCGLLVGWKCGRWNLDICHEAHFSLCMKNSGIFKLLGLTQTSTVGPTQEITPTDDFITQPPTESESTTESIDVSEEGESEPVTESIDESESQPIDDSESQPIDDSESVSVDESESEQTTEEGESEPATEPIDESESEPIDESDESEPGTESTEEPGSESGTEIIDETDSESSTEQIDESESEINIDESTESEPEPTDGQSESEPITEHSTDQTDQSESEAPGGLADKTQSEGPEGGAGDETVVI